MKVCIASHFISIDIGRIKDIIIWGWQTLQLSIFSPSLGSSNGSGTRSSWKCGGVEVWRCGVEV